MSEDIKTYIVQTKAGEEFSGYYNHANVMHVTFSDDGAVEVLEVEVPAWYASAYERGLDAEACVISYREA